MTNKDKLRKRMLERHLIFAEQAYKIKFAGEKMTEAETEYMRNQIPIIGIVPFRIAYEAGYLDGLKRLHEED